MLKNELLLVSTPFFVFIAAVLIIIYQTLANEERERQQECALKFLLSQTRGFYFYRHPLAECLSMGIVQELRERGVGDFGRPVAFLTLFALNANSAFADGRCEAVACVEVVEERNTLRDEVEIIFYEPTTSRWWKCPLDTQIGPDDFVPLGRNRQERIMARYGTIGQEITSGQITRLNECKDPSRSALTPERYYNDDAPSITQKVVDSVLSAQ